MKANKMIIPSLFTLGNFLFGFISIIRTSQGEYRSAAWYIILAVLCDGLDGRIARLYQRETVFGLELDSLGDLISSGIAPAFLLYSSVLVPLHYVAILLAFFFIMAGGYRLARYNWLNRKKRMEDYLGLPLPVAALSVSGLLLFEIRLGYAFLISGWVLWVLFLSMLMISVIPYNWPRMDFRKSVGSRIVAMAIFVLFPVLIIFPEWVLFPIFFVYISAGALRWILSFENETIRVRDLFWHDDYNGV